MKEDKQDIVFYKANQIGKGLPFAIVDHAALVSSNDIFIPSLRDFHVLFWVKKGSPTYYIDFKAYKIEPNSLVLISKDYLHYFAPFQEEVEIQSIVFSPEFIYRAKSDLTHLFSFNAGCHFDGIQMLKVDSKTSTFLEKISKHMLEVYNEWEGHTQSESFYHLLSLFILQCEKLQTSDDRDNPPNAFHDQLLRFNELLEANFRQEIKVDFYVDKLGLSAKALARMIKSQYHVSTKAVIDERRVLEIKRQLIGTNKAVKEIAYDLGFDEPTNMVKYFKKHVGQTPNGFRATTA